jgi:hypothetical protein
MELMLFHGACVRTSAGCNAFAFFLDFLFYLIYRRLFMCFLSFLICFIRRVEVRETSAAWVSQPIDINSTGTEAAITIHKKNRRQWKIVVLWASINTVAIQVCVKKSRVKHWYRARKYLGKSLKVRAVEAYKLGRGHMEVRQSLSHGKCQGQLCRGRRNVCADICISSLGTFFPLFIVKRRDIHNTETNAFRLTTRCRPNGFYDPVP